MDPISSKEFEKLSHKDTEIILKSLGLRNLRKVPRGTTMTPDFEADNVAYEATVVYPYVPLVIKELREIEGKRLGLDTHVILYSGKRGQPRTKIAFQSECQPNLSILRIRDDIDSYRVKIIRKIEHEYAQGVSFRSKIPVFDFRVAPFDSLTLGKGVSEILSDIGSDYPSLIGMILIIPKDPISSVLKYPLFFFVRNPHTHMNVPSQVKKIEGIPSSKYTISPFRIETYFKAQKGRNRLFVPPQFVNDRF